MFTQHAVKLTVLAASLLLTAGVQAGEVDPYTDDANTVVLYHLDESSGATTAVDSSSNGLDLTTGTSPFAGNSGPNGLSGAAGPFGKTDGGKQLTRTLSSSELALFSTSDFTIEAWVRNPDLTTTGDHNGILAYRGPTGRFQFTVLGPAAGANAGKLRIDYNQGGSFYGSAFSNALTWEQDQWYHVVVTYDSNTASADDSIITYYRNSIDDVSGVLQQVGQLTGQPDVDPLDVGGSLNLGGFESSSNRNFGGLVDEVRYSNGVRTSFNLAVPTPAALPAGLALMGLVTLRRRRG